MGIIEKCASSTTMVGTIREEIAFVATAFEFPSLPHYGNKPETASQSLTSRQNIRI